jgi:uncharacterized protein (TIGR03437 family)
MAVDAAGNIWVVGTTFSTDLPLLNAFQTINSGTQVVFSTDAGATWNPLSSPQPNANYDRQPATMAVDPTNASTLYVGSGSNVCKSTDAGHHFNCVALPVVATLTSLAIDPRQPATVYASLATPGGVYKSTDGGQTWTNASTGLPTPFAESIVIDPFHSNVLYAWTGSGGYVSNNGAASWQPSSLPWPPGDFFSGLRFSFDPVTPGTIYGPGFAVSGIFIQKSTDGGNSWTKLNAPFVGCCVVADPKVAGALYGGEGSLAFWKSTDGGATWVSSSVEGGVVGSIAVDPANPQIILAGQYRSTDGGDTWSATNVSRSLQPMFTPSAAGTAYALAPTTSDAFVAEFLPDGKTLVFASYFGGIDNETGNAIAIDAAGNIWIAGSTSSTDLPVTAGAFQPTLRGSTNGFIAKISSGGKLLSATYLGGSKSDAALGIAVGPQGNPWIIGSWTSTDFPFTTPPPLIPLGQQGGVLSELDSSAGQLLYSVPENGTFDSNGKGIAVDPSGNVIVTGSTGAKAFVLKVDPSGQQVYQQSFGGSQGPPVNTSGGYLPSFENAHTLGVAVVTDQAGNAYVAGTTSTSDFPVTPNAYQTTIGSGCPYYALTVNTGLIGVIGFSLIDDSFVLKLGPDGTVSYATFVGGSCYDRPTGIAVDGGGNVSIAGETDSYDYPLLSAVEAAPAYRQFASFVSSLNASGSALTFSSYLYAGSSPSVVASGGATYVSGSVGVGAQTLPDSGAYTPPTVFARDGYLAVLKPPVSAPAVNLTQVFNAFSLLPGPVAPGEIVSIGVPGFVPSQPIDVGIYVQAPLTTNLGGVGITFDGVPAYMMSISNGTIVCIAPAGIAGQSSTAVQVSINGSVSNVLSVSVAPTALGLLSLDRSGKGQADAQNPDGTLNSPGNPAPRGTAVTIFFTGGGVTTPPETDGAVPGTPAIAPAAPVSSTCTLVHALPGFVPGIFACYYPTPSNPGGPQYTVSLGSGTSQSQALLIYVK